MSDDEQHSGDEMEVESTKPISTQKERGKQLTLGAMFGKKEIDEKIKTNNNNNNNGSDVKSSGSSSSNGNTSEKNREAFQEESLPWVEKYRPKDFSDLIAHDDVIKTIQRLIDQNRLPHLLFYGPSGTGKTSTILACARRLYGNKFNSMVLELNASDDRGIGVVREQIKDFASTTRIFSTGIKLVILDEADQMTNEAQAALRRIIEKYTKSTRFCMICNQVSRIIPALQSRCTRFRFGPLPQAAIKQRISHVIESEKVNIDESGIDALLRLSEGDMRKALNILQATSMSYPVIDELAVYQCTGQPLPSDIEKILNWMMNEDFTTAYTNIQQLKTEKGLALQDIIREAHSYVIRLNLDASVMMNLIKELADVEFRLSSGTSEKIQLGSLVGIFRIAAEEATSSG